MTGFLSGYFTGLRVASPQALVPAAARAQTQDLFVSNANANAISRAFGPSVPVVPEASTTVSLGLLPALGMGGVVSAAKKRKSAV